MFLGISPEILSTISPGIFSTNSRNPSKDSLRIASRISVKNFSSNSLQHFRNQVFRRAPPKSIFKITSGILIKISILKFYDTASEILSRILSKLLPKFQDPARILLGKCFLEFGMELFQKFIISYNQEFSRNSSKKNI